MTTTSDANPSDTATAMAVDDDPKQPAPSNEPRATSPTNIHSMKLKFEFRAKNEEFNIRDVHRELMFAIANECPGSIFRHNHKNDNDPFDPFISSDDLMESVYTYKFFKKSNYHLACVAHTIETQATFETIKDTCKTILRDNDGFVRINKWSDADLDVATAGWIFESNPIIHHRDYIHKMIKSYCLSFNETYYPIDLQAKTISYTNRTTKIKIQSQAIHILCRREDMKQVQQMLQTMYSDDEFHGPGKFIPIDIVAKQNASTLEKLITLQKLYLENHRSITVVGVSLASLNQIPADSSNDTLFDLVHHCDWIDWMTTTSKTETTGRIIFSTTSEKYHSAIEWIETKFLPYHHSIRHRIDPTDSDGKSYRVARNGRATQPADDYSTNIANTISTISVPSNPPNAWSKPLIIGDNTNPSLSTMTHSSNPKSNQQSTYNTLETLNSKIDTLSNTIDKLQQQLSQQAEQQQTLLSSITTIIEQQIDKRFENIQSEIDNIRNQYVAIADQVNESWSKKYQSLQKTLKTKSSTDTEAPGSGSNRARKQPRTAANLSSVQRNLFQNPLALIQTSTDKNKQNESTK